MKKRILNMLIIFFVLCILNVVNVSAEIISPSYTYTRTDNGKLFADIAIGDDLSVLVGKNGRIYVYENSAFTCVESGMFEDFNQVEYYCDKFIAISDDLVIESGTGKEWKVVSRDNNFRPDGLVISANDKIIVEKQDGIYETSDFITYNKISSASSKTNRYAENMQVLGLPDKTYSMEEVKKYYEMIFGENNSLDSTMFGEKLALFINLLGIEARSLPVNVDNIEFMEMNDTSLIIYYIKNFKLIKSETVDLKIWTDTVIDLPEQNYHLSNIVLGKMNDDFFIMYDTNDSIGIYKTRKIVKTTDMIKFKDIVTTDVRGNVIASNGKIFILTSTSIYEIFEGYTKTLVKDETSVNEKKSIITTSNADFMWQRDGDIKLFWNKTGQWQEITADNFITSHFIDGNANYQIIWTGNNYIVRPTDYDNGYNPTNVGGNLEIYDEMFNHVKSVTLKNYILQMSYVDNKCYVLTNSNEVLYSCDFEKWNKSEETELPLSNGSTKIYKSLVKSEQDNDYIHNVKSVMNQNIKKGVLYETWYGDKIDLSSDMYLRYDENIVSFSKDGIYWKDIILPDGIDNIQKVYVNGDTLVITTSEIELSYFIELPRENTIKTYVEIDNKILGFDTEPVIESDRTLVPLRFIFETLGADVEWKDSTQSAIVQNDETTILFSIDNTTATVNSINKTMDVPARLINDKTMVPLRFLSEELGFYVEWDEDTRTATISK